MNSNATELKPCPFCGGVVKISQETDFCGDNWYEIKGCDCKLIYYSEPFVFVETSKEKRNDIKMDLIKKWNRRN